MSQSPRPSVDPIRRFRTIMARLRAPGGCPWDREQTPETLTAYVLEEAHEVVEAVEGGCPDELREELGDLLLQVVFLSQIAAERDWFDFDDVATGIADKMERRHPHVFGDAEAESAQDVALQWEALKAKEGKRTLGGVPTALPALLRALRIGQKAAKVGFDWTEPVQVLDKVEEEIGELREAVAHETPERVADEFGDLLYALVNYARRMDIDPEAALRRTTNRFVRRFDYIEDTLKAQGRTPLEAQLDELEALWVEAKSREAS